MSFGKSRLYKHSVQSTDQRAERCGTETSSSLKTELLLIGGGGHCRSCIEVIESTGEFQIRGIVGLPEEVGGAVLGYKVIGCDNDLPSLLRECPIMIVTIGQIKSPQLRIRTFENCRRLNAIFPKIIASSAVVSRYATIGSGTIVMHGAVINAGAVIGTNTIINTLALVEHDTHIGDHCHVSTAAVLNGHVRVGDETFVGSGVVVHQCVQIGSQAIIAAGMVVNRDVSNGEIIRTLPVQAGARTNA